MAKKFVKQKLFCLTFAKNPTPVSGAFLGHQRLRLLFLGFLGFWPKRDICVQVLTKNPSGHHRRGWRFLGQKVGGGSGVFLGPLFSLSFWGQKGAERAWCVYQGRFFWPLFLAKNPEFIFGQFLAKNWAIFWPIFGQKIGQKLGHFWPIFGQKMGQFLGHFLAPFLAKNPVRQAFWVIFGVQKWPHFWAIF